MLTYVAVSAIEIGVNSDFAFYFIAIANASSLFGRYAAGRVADITGKTPSLSNNEEKKNLTKAGIIGPMNIMIPFTAWTGILTYAWPFAKSKSSLISVTVIYGSVA